MKIISSGPAMIATAIHQNYPLGSVPSRLSYISLREAILGQSWKYPIRTKVKLYKELAMTALNEIFWKYILSNVSGHFHVCLKFWSGHTCHNLGINTVKSAGQDITVNLEWNRSSNSDKIPDFRAYIVHFQSKSVSYTGWDNDREPGSHKISKLRRNIL